MDTVERKKESKTDPMIVRRERKEAESKQKAKIKPVHRVDGKP